jgi:hypothetical protein
MKTIRITLLFGFILLVSQRFVLCQTESEDTTDTVKLSFSGRLDLSTNYDDNILNYSPIDILKMDTVKYGSNNLKKFSINRLSDDITSAKVRLTFSANWFEHNPTTFRLKNNSYLYNSNYMRNYSSWEFEAKQVFFTKNYFSISYNILPRYYLRNFWYHQIPERNPYKLFSRYVEAYLHKQGFAIQLGRNFTKRFSLNIEYEHENAAYNTEFSERDNRTNNLKIGASYKLNRLVDVSGSYRYSLSKANGRDNPDSTIADISYRSHRYTVGADFSLRSLTGIPLSLNADAVFEYQKYLSNKIPVLTYGDKYHYGRVDKFYKITTGLTYRFSKRFDLYVQYYWENNNTNLAETSDTGGYQAHQIGIGANILF